MIIRFILLDKKINEIKYKSHIILILIWLYEVQYLLLFSPDIHPMFPIFLFILLFVELFFHLLDCF